MINPIVQKNLEREEKISEKSVKKFEKKIKASLPRDYRDFLLETNGGYLKRVLVYPFTENGRATEEGISMFHSLSDEDGGSLVENFETYRDKEEPRMLGNMIPIAEDEGGNQIVLLLNKKELGHVYFWDHENEVDFENLKKGENDRANCHLIATSFSEFLGLLKEDE